jgi:NAD(P)-dependent dehydrogenase (short-subunit alcohol dehydrogenase family)
MTQRLAVELGPSGVRVVCLRPHAVPDAASKGSYTAKWGEDQTLLGRLPTLAQVADAAVFLASDRGERSPDRCST